MAIGDTPQAACDTSTETQISWDLHPSVYTNQGTPVAVPPCCFDVTTTATCDVGDIAVGGGFDGNSSDLRVWESVPSGSDGWSVSAFNIGAQVGVTIGATVRCLDL